MERIFDWQICLIILKWFKELDGLMLQLKENVLDYNKSYYIDFEAYNTVKDNIDYLKIYKNISEESNSLI